VRFTFQPYIHSKEAKVSKCARNGQTRADEVNSHPLLIVQRQRYTCQERLPKLLTADERQNLKDTVVSTRVPKIPPQRHIHFDDDDMMESLSYPRGSQTSS
jgi:hypothetical protein